MKRLASLAVLAFVALSTMANLALVVPNRTEVWIDAAAGSDITGNGSQESPVASCDAGAKRTASIATLWFVGSSGSPAQYNCSIPIRKELHYRAVEAGGVTLTGLGGASAAFVIDPPSGQTVRFTDVAIDPSLNPSGAKPRCMDLLSQATTYSLVLTNVSFAGWSTNCINTPAASFKGNVAIDASTFVGGTVNTTIFISTAIDGGLTVTNSNFTVTNAQAPGAGAAIYFRSTAAGPTVSITGTNTTTTFASGLALNQYFSVEIVDTPGAIIDGGAHACTITGVAQCWAVGFQRVSATLGISGSEVKNTTCTVNSAASGACLFNSTDSPYTDNTLSAGVKFDNNIVNDINGTTHAIFQTTCLSCFIRTNQINGGSLCLVDKNNSGLTASGNQITDCRSAHLLPKGSTGSTYTNNTINITATTTGEAYRCENNADTGLDCTGVTLTGNIFNYDGATNRRFVSVAVNSSTTFNNNAYNNLSGTLPTNKWTYGASNYSTFAAWQAAHGATDTSNIPLRRPANDNRRPAVVRRRRLPERIAA